MRLSIRQTGGFAGQAIDLASTDIAQLRKPVRTQVEALLKQISVEVDRRQHTIEEVIADAMNYELEIEEIGQLRTISLIDDDGPGATLVRQLIGLLQTEMTRPRTTARRKRS